jgi:hypothetical protein
MRLPALTVWGGCVFALASLFLSSGGGAVAPTACGPGMKAICGTIKCFPDFEREYALKSCEAWQNKKDRHPY